MACLAAGWRGAGPGLGGSGGARCGCGPGGEFVQPGLGRDRHRGDDQGFGVHRRGRGEVRRRGGRVQRAVLCRDHRHCAGRGLDWAGQHHRPRRDGGQPGGVHGPARHRAVGAERPAGHDRDGGRRRVRGRGGGGHLSRRGLQPHRSGVASATSGGAFAGVAAQVPAGAPNPGTACFTAVGRHSGLSAQAQFSVRDTVRVISPGNQASVTGTAVRVPVSASDTGPGQALSFTAAGLPPGLEAGNESGAAGVISGVPAEPGNFAVTVTARDASGASGSAAFSWAVTNQVTVTSSGNQVSAIGTAASLQIQAADSQTGQELTYAAEGLPPGLSASPATGLISGIPAELGDFAVTVTAQDSTGASGSAGFSWAVTNPVTVTSPGNQFSPLGLEVSLQLQATGQAILTWTAEGLPPRLDIGTGPGGAGVISGIPAEPGDFAVTVTALDVTGLSGSAQFQWQVL